MFGRNGLSPEGRPSQHVSRIMCRPPSWKSDRPISLPEIRSGDETIDHPVPASSDLAKHHVLTSESDAVRSDAAIPPRAHLGEKTSHSMPSSGASSISDQHALKIASWSNPANECLTSRLGIRERFVEEYRKNYCPRTSPPLVLPSAPTDKEKLCFLNMKRISLLSCALFAFSCIAVGAWMFAKAAPIFAWYGVYALITHSYLFASLFITAIGKPFDPASHRNLVNRTNLDESTAPAVDIYLPVCKEPLELLENTWRHVAKLQYPAAKASVFVLDDGANESVKLMARKFGYNYIVRPDRPELRKAGNLRHAFSQTSGEYFTVFDADFCPRPDFLLETVPYLIDDPKRAILQTPQYFRSTAEQTWVEQGAGPGLEHNYRIMQTCRDRWGAAMCTGSNAIYRRTALEPVGGTFPVAHSEDNYTGVYVLTAGWTMKYIPLVLACGNNPDTPIAYFNQQMRWCSGSTSLCFSKSFWKSSLAYQQKICYSIGFLAFGITAAQAILVPLPAPLILWSRPDLFKYYNLLFAFPCLLLDLVVIPIWLRTRWTLSMQYVNPIMSYAYLQSIWDHFFGTKMGWIPSGAAKLPLDRRRYISAYGYTQAKALMYPKHGSPVDVLTLHTHSISPPHSNLLTLRTLAAPLNPADINQIQGTYPTAPPFTRTLGTPETSAVPGNEACFEVLSAGSGCKNLAKGDWVIPRQTGLGTWRTHLQVEEDNVMKVDKDGLKPEQVATVSVNPVTAYRMLKDFAELTEGDWFIQNGANSGVGRAAVQLGAMWGLKSICIIRQREGAEGDELRKEMLNLGATVVVSDQELMETGFGERVKEWTNGGRRPPKLALNCVGGDAGMALAKTLAAGGIMITYGAMSKSPLRVGAGMLIFKDLRFVGFWVSKWGDRLPEEKKKTIDEVLGLITEGKFRDVPMVEMPWSWDTKKEELLDTVQGTLEGFRKGKGIFKFGDT
ncbi:MAG: hypothetical protein Q9218_004098 [Villophora microphyllina]